MATNNSLNPPQASEAVLAGSNFSFSWYNWFAQTVARILNAPVSSSAPAKSSSAGTPGQIAYDQNYLYVCTGNNSWKRSPLTAF
jgi:hypothetical protein